MQNNWKNSIKNAFKHREIEPQRDLWSELEKQLDQHEVKPLKKKRLLYFAAASITVLIGLGTFVFHYFGQTNISENKVITNISKPQENSQTNLLIQEVDTMNLISKEKIVVAKEKPEQSVKSNEKKIIAEQSLNIDKEVDKYVDDAFQGISSDEIIAQVQKEAELERRIDSIYNSMAFSDISVDELLLIASAEIKIDQYVESQSDTKKMLSDVEKLNLKERIHLFFDKVSNEYDKLKIAFIK